MHSVISDAMCSGIIYPSLSYDKITLTPGPEHTAAAENAVQPSYYTLPLFHPPMDADNAQVGLGYVSSDGHLFSCRNPVIMQQAFHV